jgi:hypothetical protein
VARAAGELRRSYRRPGPTTASRRTTLMERKPFRVKDDPFERLLGTVRLTRTQWIVCILVALSVVVVSEVRKLVLGRRVPETVAAEELAEAPAVPTAS